MKVLVAIYGDTIAWTIPPEHTDALRRRFPGVVFAHAETEDDMVRLIADAEVAFSSRVTPRVFAAATQLRWVHSPAAGVGSMLFPALRESRVLLTNSRGLASTAVAEHAIALLLALSRHLPTVVRRQMEGVWAQEELSGLPPLRGRCLCVVGLGSIGQEIARLAAAFGMDVVGTRRRPELPVPPGVRRVVSPAELSRLLPDADFVVLAAPLTAGTRGMIGASEFGRMKPTAILVNVARGRIVREADLVDALRSGTIAGAGLDVFEHEPVAPSSPLWSLPNAIVSPHIAGYCAGYWEAAVELFSDCLGCFLRGEPLANIVDRDAGY
jgi:phosphoglycerate dehydrogenase-like enzyme